MRIWEIVALMPKVEEANIDYIAQLLALPPPSPPVVPTPLQPLAIATYSSEGSNLAAVVAADNENEE